MSLNVSIAQKPTLTPFTAAGLARCGRFLACVGLFFAVSADGFALIPPVGTYVANTATVPVEQTITAGGIGMKVEKTIRLTPKPVSAMYPFLKAIRLNNGDLLLSIPNP